MGKQKSVKSSSVLTGAHFQSCQNILLWLTSPSWWVWFVKYGLVLGFIPFWLLSLLARSGGAGLWEQIVSTCRKCGSPPFPVLQFYTGEGCSGLLILPWSKLETDHRLRFMAFHKFLLSSVVCLGSSPLPRNWIIKKAGEHTEDSMTIAFFFA